MPLMIHHGELDERVNASWPAFQKALMETNVRMEEFTYKVNSSIRTFVSMSAF